MTVNICKVTVFPKPTIGMYPLPKVSACRESQTGYFKVAVPQKIWGISS